MVCAKEVLVWGISVLGFVLTKFNVGEFQFLDETLFLCFCGCVVSLIWTLLNRRFWGHFLQDLIQDVVVVRDVLFVIFRLGAHNSNFKFKFIIKIYHNLIMLAKLYKTTRRKIIIPKFWRIITNKIYLIWTNASIYTWYSWINKNKNC